MLLVRVAAVLVATVLVAGCSSAQSTACRCPQPVNYDDATIKQITAALKALPPDNVLHQAMDDYEDERDDLRICLGIRN
jgi:outer membrane murein-binding lipoprotein Lpp